MGGDLPLGHERVGAIPLYSVEGGKQVLRFLMKMLDARRPLPLSSVLRIIVEGNACDVWARYSLGFYYDCKLVVPGGRLVGIVQATC